MSGKMISSSDEIRNILQTSRRIVMLGASRNPARPSHGIFSYLVAHGYEVIPVNPGGGELAGVPIERGTGDITPPVDIVNVFRNPATLDDSLIDECKRLRAKVLWMQDGVVRPDLAEKATQEGIDVVMDDCIYRRHSML